MGRHSIREQAETQSQKQNIVNIATASRDARDKESSQAILNDDIEEIVPEISIKTFENIMYEVGYARRRPGWKPSLAHEQEQERYAWAIAQNPGKDKEYDNKGFNFRK